MGKWLVMTRGLFIRIQPLSNQIVLFFTPTLDNATSAHPCHSADGVHTACILLLSPRVVSLFGSIWLNPVRPPNPASALSLQPRISPDLEDMRLCRGPIIRRIAEGKTTGLRPTVMECMQLERGREARLLLAMVAEAKGGAVGDIRGKADLLQLFMLCERPGERR